MGDVPVEGGRLVKHFLHVLDLSHVPLRNVAVEVGLPRKQLSLHDQQNKWATRQGGSNIPRQERRGVADKSQLDEECI